MTFLGGFLGSAILYIIGAAFFFLGALVACVGAAKEAARLGAALLALLASICLLVGAAIFIGGYQSGGYTLISGGVLGDSGASSAVRAQRARKTGAQVPALPYA